MNKEGQSNNDPNIKNLEGRIQDKDEEKIKQ